MLEILAVSERKRVTNTQALTVVFARCAHCGAFASMLKQNVVKHNQLGRTRCKHCVQGMYHHLTNTRIWRTWSAMKFRAMDETDRNYGGRGIGICKEWETFSNFYEDMRHGYQDDLTIERVDVNKGYCKENCTWVTPMAQQANKRTNRNLLFGGQMYHLAELCRRTGLTKSRLKSRLDAGMSPEEAVRAALNSTYGTGRHAKKAIASGRKPRCPTSTTSLTAALSIGS